MRTDDRELARKATILAYLKRFPGTPDYADAYQGAFPAKEFADALPVPTGHGLTEHRRHWQKLYRAFDKAWAEYTSRG